MKQYITALKMFQSGSILSRRREKWARRYKIPSPDAAVRSRRATDFCARSILAISIEG